MFRIGSSLGSVSSFDAREDAEINMAPLIDMIFILLIFFLVTASFVRECGVEINRPEAITAEDKKAAGLFIPITVINYAFSAKWNAEFMTVGIIQSGD